MKRYTNHGTTMAAIHFSDGSTKFLFRGQSIEVDEEPTRVEGNVRVKNLTRRKPKTESVSE